MSFLGFIKNLLGIIEMDYGTIVLKMLPKTGDLTKFGTLAIFTDSTGQGRYVYASPKGIDRAKSAGADLKGWVILYPSISQTAEKMVLQGSDGKKYTWFLSGPRSASSSSSFYDSTSI